ncbi:MAG: acyl-CoA dehydrogenase family protein, partial [Pseudorhodoplanes sp.]|nr:acyl-CoA dehydrogenase family protein [Pseudorhodoplanes sp.]
MPLSVTSTSALSWPFFDNGHRKFAERLGQWAAAKLPHIPHHDVDDACRLRVKLLAEGRFLTAVVPGAFGGLHNNLDVRTLCLAREILAYHDGLADFAFAMQGLGSGSITLYGSPEVKLRYLPRVRDGQAIAAFALSEPEAGSDVAAMATTAVPDGPGHFRINGVKTWISNGGIADYYVVFARTGEAPGARGLSAFVVDADTLGLSVTERIEVIAPHPLATLSFEDVRVPVDNRLGQGGEGFKVAMATLDIFRSTVGAAALGFARRALDEALGHVAQRRIYGATLADL